MNNLYGVDQYFEVIELYQLDVQFRPYGHEASGTWRVYQALNVDRGFNGLYEGWGNSLVEAIDSFLEAIEND